MPNDNEQSSLAFLSNPFVRKFLIPGLFIILWAHGFIGAKLVLPFAEPWTVLTLRFFLVALLLTGLALVTRAPWPGSKRDLFHMAVLGLLLQAIYLGGNFVGMASGVDAATASLISALPPVLTAGLAYLFLKERMRWFGWLGLIIGLAGVAIVVSLRYGLGLGTSGGYSFVFVAAIALAVAAAYQKRFLPQFYWMTNLVVQYAAAGLFTLCMAFLFEDRSINWSPRFFVGLAILVLLLSIGAVGLLQLLIKQSAATGVMSLLFLVPVATGLIAWPLFGETFSLFAIFGFLMAVLGVALVQKSL